MTGVDDAQIEKIPKTQDTETGGVDQFKRVLGFRSLLAVAIGLVVSQGVMVMILQGVGIGGLGFFIPLGIAFLLALSYAFSFSELALMLPRAGSLSTYTEVAIGHFPAMVATFAGYVVVAMFALSAELLLVDLMLNELFPGYLPPMTIAFGILVIFTALNVIGIDIFARLQSLLAFSMLTVLLLLGAVSISGTGAPQSLNIELFDNWNPLGAEVFTLIAIAIWGFVGAEFVCPMIEETRNPERNIPRSMIAGICIIMLVYILYCLGALFYVPAENLAQDALPHKTFVHAMFGDSGLIFLATAAITATCSTVNTSIAAIPRMLYGMAHNGQAFSVFKRVHPQYKTPWVAILFIAFISGMPLVILNMEAEAITLLLIAASMSWLLAYIIVHIDVIVLRKRLPNAKRPFKTPFYPLPQIFGIVGMAYAAFYNSPSPELTQKVYLTAGVVLLLVCVTAALWVKYVMKKKLFEPESVKHALED